MKGLSVSILTLWGLGYLWHDTDHCSWWQGAEDQCPVTRQNREMPCLHRHPPVLQLSDTIAGRRQTLSLRVPRARSRRLRVPARRDFRCFICFRPVLRLIAHFSLPLWAEIGDCQWRLSALTFQHYLERRATGTPATWIPKKEFMAT